MLEFNYNSLDDEFVTFWSRHLTGVQDIDMLTGLERLAEKGQINAIQNWYLYNEVGKNKKIDKIVESMKGENFNELYAMANYFFMRPDLFQKFCDLNTQYQDIEDDIIECAEEEGLSVEDMEEDLEDIKKQIFDMPHVKLIYKAYNEATKCYKETKNILVLSTANEILDCIPQMIPLNIDTDEMEAKTKKQNEIIHKYLLTQYRNNAQDNPQFSPADKPNLAFQLAKTILAFHESDEDSHFAYGLLELLGDRACESIDGFDIGNGEVKFSL